MAINTDLGLGTQPHYEAPSDLLVEIVETHWVSEAVPSIMAVCCDAVEHPNSGLKKFLRYCFFLMSVSTNPSLFQIIHFRNFCNKIIVTG